jgi:hypothetical protein
VSWHFLQGQAEESWAGNSLDGAPDALLRLMPTPEASYLPAKPMGALTRSPFGMTLQRLTGASGGGALMWCQAGSPVRTYHQPERVLDLMGQGLDYGPRWPGSLARCSPPMSGWKTRQCSLLGGLSEFSGILPRWGMMQDGECFPLLMLEHLTSVSGSGYWDTPCKADAHPRAYNRNKPYTGKGQKHLQAQAYERLTHACVPGGKLNPDWVEWLMGWPLGWTGLQPLEMGKFRRWLDLHGMP